MHERCRQVRSRRRKYASHYHVTPFISSVFLSHLYSAKPLNDAQIGDRFILYLMENQILYQPDNEVKLEVRIEDETVWLNRQQLSELFNRDVKTIGKHVNNALKEELAGISVVADGKTYQVEYYNLDMVLSVGYRVKSNWGIEFRRWANRVLKEYLLKGNIVLNKDEEIKKGSSH